MQVTKKGKTLRKVRYRMLVVKMLQLQAQKYWIRVLIPKDWRFRQRMWRSGVCRARGRAFDLPIRLCEKRFTVERVEGNDAVGNFGSGVGGYFDQTKYFLHRLVSLDSCVLEKRQIASLCVSETQQSCEGKVVLHSIINKYNINQ